MKVLVTGAAGFIGFHVAKALLDKGHQVVGIDNLNSYYSVELKEARLQQLSSFKDFRFYKADISHPAEIEEIWQKENGFENVIHLAAQAGVRYSLIDPYPYITSNLMGFTVLLERCRHQPDFQHLVYASTSSVYGTNKEFPFKEEMRTDSPMSLYAATKKANELMAQSYNHLYALPVTGLRFFTVYGPWGRPDMSLFKFTKAILNDETIDVYNNGNMSRDYTYVDDIVDGILAALNHPQTAIPCQQHPVYNIGNSKQESLMHFIEVLEETLGKKAKKNFMPLQAGDVPETFSDVTKAEKDLGYSPKVPIRVGISNFVNWYKSFYKL